jgi:hypothetical protein
VVVEEVISIKVPLAAVWVRVCVIPAVEVTVTNTVEACPVAALTVLDTIDTEEAVAVAFDAPSWVVIADCVVDAAT